jgi:DNA-binding transcriptional ArsR family regulator
MMNPSGQAIKKEFEKNSALCEHVVTLLHLISNKVRFRIVCLLTRGEFCVNDIMDVVDEGSKLSNISQQLTILRLGGIVQKRRQNKLIIYAIKDERVRQLIEFLCRQYLKQAA